jgi:hypothetical protein
MNAHPSWSQYALGSLAFILTIALYNISVIYRDRSWLHFARLEPVFWGLRREHLDRITGILFFGIMITPVTLLDIYPEANSAITRTIVLLHYVFTGAGLLVAYSGVWTCYIKGSAKWKGMVLTMVIGALGFGWSFMGAPYTIGFGELLASIAPMIYILTTNKD